MADPRLTTPPATVNEVLMDRTIRHQLFLLRVGNRHAAQMRRLLRDARADALGLLTARLERITARGYDLSPATTARLEDMLVALEALLDGSLLDAQRRLTGDLETLVDSEAVFARGLVRQTLPIAWDVAAPTGQSLRSIATARPFQGRLLKDWFGGLEAQQKTLARQAVQLGMSQGESIPQIAQRLRRDVLDLREDRAAILARTATVHVSNHAREATYQANADLIKAVKLIETLDTRTCTQCMRLDGKTYPIDQGPRPPHHLGCRGSSTPVLKSLAELGLPAATLPTGTRASMNGQVPADLTYSAWLKRQSAALQDEALGPTRGRLYRAGLDVSAFTDRQGRQWTLKELEAREADAFDAAGLKRAA